MSVYDEVATERSRQDSAWGHLDCQPFVYLAVLVEEVGEVARAMHDAVFGTLPLETRADLRTELVQVAAVAVQIVERLDEGRIQWP